MSIKGAAIFLAAIMVALLAGCGGGGDDSSAGATAASGCAVGRSVLDLVPNAPEWWTKGRGEPLILACNQDHFHGSAAIIGYGSAIGEGSCIVAYNFRLHQAHGELCVAEGERWAISCQMASACVVQFMHEAGVTQIDGIATVKAKGIRVLVKGKPIKDGVAIARIKGELARRISVTVPVNFFLIFIRGCVWPKQVKIEMLNADGSVRGTLKTWTLGVPECSYRINRAVPTAS